MQVIDFLIDDAYNTLVSQEKSWPKQLTKEDRLDFIDKVHAYWELKQDYGKCRVWYDFKMKVE